MSKLDYDKNNLFQEREFITIKIIYFKKENLEKQQHNYRFGQYPKDSILLSQIVCKYV